MQISPFSLTTALGVGADAARASGAGSRSTLLDTLNGDGKTGTAETGLMPSGKSAKEQAAEAAKLKLDRLRERLKTIMMMGGDPAKVARAAAQIVKEIGQAAKAYAQAGGSAAGAAAPSPTPSSPAAPVDAGAEAADAATAAAPPAENPAGRPPVDARPSDEAQDDPGVIRTGGDDKDDRTTAGLGSSDSDDPVIKAARKLAEAARALFTASVSQAERKGDATLETEKKQVKDGDEDLRDAATAVGGFGAGGYGAGPGEVEPTISILA